ncbi:hypothetical protein [Shewanella frigidimarina]|uniref:hypothetical protein n=2 Tax=Shewanella frigidimarina TaxID=56812 RepID=UPI0014051689|nr:hypothetical protein [Shewanella frigidimarina]
MIRVGRMARDADRKMMARELDIDHRILTSLLPLDFVERNMATNEVRRGNLTKRKIEQVETLA